MKKLVEIDNCLDCPHGSIVGCKCSKANRKIPPKDEESIPEWCPLPDAGRATESKVVDVPCKYKFCPECGENIIHRRKETGK